MVVLPSGKTLSELRVVDLKKELERRSLSKAGSKQALMERLKVALQNEGCKSDDADGFQEVSEDSSAAIESDIVEVNDPVRLYMEARNRKVGEGQDLKRQFEKTLGSESSVESSPTKLNSSFNALENTDADYEKQHEGSHSSPSPPTLVPHANDDSQCHDMECPSQLTKRPDESGIDEVVEVPSRTRRRARESVRGGKTIETQEDQGRDTITSPKGRRRGRSSSKFEEEGNTSDMSEVNKKANQHQRTKEVMEDVKQIVEAESVIVDVPVESHDGLSHTSSIITAPSEENPSVAKEDPKESEDGKCIENNAVSEQDAVIASSQDETPESGVTITVNESVDKIGDFIDDGVDADETCGVTQLHAGDNVTSSPEESHSDHTDTSNKEEIIPTPCDEGNGGVVVTDNDGNMKEKEVSIHVKTGDLALSNDDEVVDKSPDVKGRVDVVDIVTHDAAKNFAHSVESNDVIIQPDVRKEDISEETISMDVDVAFDNTENSLASSKKRDGKRNSAEMSDVSTKKAKLSAPEDEVKVEESKVENSDVLKKDTVEKVSRKRKWGTAPMKATSRAAVTISSGSLKTMMKDVSTPLEAPVELDFDDAQTDDEVENVKAEHKSLREDGEMSEDSLMESAQVSVEKDGARNVVVSHEDRTVTAKSRPEVAVTPGVVGGETEVISEGSLSVSECSDAEAEMPLSHSLEKRKTKDPIKIINRRVDDPILRTEASFKQNLETSDTIEMKNAPSSKYPVSCLVYIENLVRPFTNSQLKELLSRYGTLDPDVFWIDRIKNRCFLKYCEEADAVRARNALCGAKWPSFSHKILTVEYACQKELDLWRETEGQPEEAIMPRVEVIRRHQRSLLRQVIRSQDEDLPESSKSVPLEESHEEKEKPARREKQQSRREKETSMQVKEEGTTPTFEDLFRRTKALPQVCWLPLTTEKAEIRFREKQKFLLQERKLKEEEEQKRQEERQRRAEEREERNRKEKERMLLDKERREKERAERVREEERKRRMKQREEERRRESTRVRGRDDDRRREKRSPYRRRESPRRTSVDRGRGTRRRRSSSRSSESSSDSSSSSSSDSSSGKGRHNRRQNARRRH